MAETKKNIIINSIEISLRKQTTIIDLPERGYRVVVNNEVVSMSNLSPRHRKNQHAMFPVANRLLERIIT